MQLRKRQAMDAAAYYCPSKSAIALPFAGGRHNLRSRLSTPTTDCTKLALLSI